METRIPALKVGTSVNPQKKTLSYLLSPVPPIRYLRKILPFKWGVCAYMMFGKNIPEWTKGPTLRPLYWQSTWLHYYLGRSLIS